MHIGDRFQHLVLDANALGRGAGLRLAVGHDAGQHVADVARLLANGNHQRPVLADEADEALAGHVGGGEDAPHAGHSRRFAGVNGQHTRPWVVAEAQRAVEHTGQEDVGHVAVAAKDEVAGVVLGVACTDAAVGLWRRHLLFLADGLGGAFDGVNDLLITGATAEVGRQGLGDLVARRLRVLVDQGVGLDHHAGDAEAALHATLTDEGVGKDVLAIFAQPFDGRHVAAGATLHGRNAGQDGLTVQVHGATAAGGLRGATILGRDDALVQAQIGQEGQLGVAIVLLEFTVEPEVHCVTPLKRMIRRLGRLGRFQKQNYRLRSAVLSRDYTD